MPECGPPGPVHEPPGSGEPPNELNNAAEALSEHKARVPLVPAEAQPCADPINGIAAKNKNRRENMDFCKCRKIIDRVPMSKAAARPIKLRKMPVFTDPYALDLQWDPTIGPFGSINRAKAEGPKVPGPDQR